MLFMRFPIDALFVGAPDAAASAGSSRCASTCPRGAAVVLPVRGAPGVRRAARRERSSATASGDLVTIEDRDLASITPAPGPTGASAA